MAKFGDEAPGEWVADIAVDQANCCVGRDNPPAGSTAVHHDCRDGKEANERQKGSPAGVIHIHGVSPGFGGFRPRRIGFGL
jgi:hypothetical protein